MQDILSNESLNKRYYQGLLKRDIFTGWNNTLYMLQVILEQKIALATYAIEYGGVQQLTAAQLDLAGKFVKVLGCVKEIIKSMSTETASKYSYFVNWSLSCIVFR